MERQNRPQTFLDNATRDLGGPRTKATLDRLDGAVDWKRLASIVRRLPEYRRKSTGGRPAWPAEMMLRCIMLAQWFNLSDPQLEECLQDRLSFRRFIGLSLEDSTPDETTFSVFRKRLREAKLDRTLFDAFVQQMEKAGLIVHEGTLVDATIIEQARGQKKADGSRTRDDDATFTKKHGQKYHGYKLHAATDRQGLITDLRVTTAKVHDSRLIDELTERETRLVAADSAYASKERRAALWARGVVPAIIYKRSRGQAELYDSQIKLNKLFASIRAAVEHPFAMIKRDMGLRRCRYRGLDRNEQHFTLAAIAANIKRSCHLRERASPT